MTRFLFYTILLFLSFNLISAKGFSQDIPIVFSGKLNKKGLNKNAITIYSFLGSQLIKLDSVYPNKKGNFKFSLTLPDHPGYYRLSMLSDNYTDVILKKGENPIIEFESGELKKWKKVSSSEENTAIFESHTISQNAASKKEAFTKMKDYCQKIPKTYFAQTTLAYLPYDFFLTDTFQVEAKKYSYIHEHYFDNCNFSNSNLVYSTLLPNIYMRYFENYTQYDEEGFKSSVDIIMKNAALNENVFSFTIDFLITLFKKVGPDLILEYIIEQYYFNNSCGLEIKSDMVTQIISDYELIREGEKIPAFNLLPENRDMDSVSILELCKKNKVTLLVFWSSYCHYCAAKSPIWNEITEAYKKKGLETIYFSLDTDSSEFNEGLISKKLDGIQVCELKGWDGEIVKQLKVNRTPYTFLLDSNGKILLKDKSEDQLIIFLSNLLK